MLNTTDLILAELRKPPSVSVVNTVLNDGNDATFTIYQIMPCSPDIYCIFQNPETRSLYALQNVGSQFWAKLSNGIMDDLYFLLPITNYLIQNRENCLRTFYKSCRESELGNIPIIKEEFINPFI
jgi:hypothetical protein